MANIPRNIRTQLFKEMAKKYGRKTGAIELTTDLDLLTAGKKMQWPENWQKRREAVMSCVNLNALEDLLETEKDSRVRPAIVKQIKGQVEA
jgi:hypothetical protein